MGRRIVTRQLESTRGSAQVDTYFDKVIKYIPADVVAAWTVVVGLVSSAGEQIPKATILWVAYAFGLLMTGLWTWKQTEDKKKPFAKTQIGIAVIAFAIWVAAIGGPFDFWPAYERLYGSLLLIAYTLTVGLVTPPES
ncbi:MAG: hypothetical protein AAFQ89_17800 [Cyanobacteria bacterium J06626_18]